MRRLSHHTFIVFDRGFSKFDPIKRNLPVDFKTDFLIQEKGK
ncbi:MAG TPA: hypothetical protein VFC65_07545 [Prolixibacteraceae bacterium]|nr:hypothetical protein [Prolixibacteraceae bacterium]